MPSRSRPLSSVDFNPTFFVDRNIGYSVVQVIEDAGYQAIYHDTRFPPTTPDTEWLREAGRNGWIVLSQDENIARNVNELVALIDARVHAFFIVLKRQTGEILAEVVERSITQMVEIAARKDPPSLGLIRLDGKVGRLEGWDQLRDRVQSQVDRIGLDQA